MFLPETEQRTRLVQTQERLQMRAAEFMVSPVPGLTSLIVSEANEHRLRPFEKVGFTTQEGQRVSFNATNNEGKELVERVITRIYRQYGAQADWQDLAGQVRTLSTTFRPLRKELGAQIEVAQALFPEPLTGVICVGDIGSCFQANLKRFTRESRTGRKQLTASGKRFTEATYQWLGRLFPEAGTDDLKEIIKTNFGDLPETGLLRQSLFGKINWEQKQHQYLVLEQQNPEKLFSPQYYNELQTELQGATRFQYELSLAIEKAEQELGREIDIQAEVRAFEAVLEVEASLLEAENNREIEAVATVQEDPKTFKGKVKAGWDRFTNWFVREKGYKKVALAAVSAVSLGVVLATCAGIPQRLFNQEPLLPDRPQPDSRSTGEPGPDLSRAAVAAPQWQPLANNEAVFQTCLVQPPEPRPELKAAQDEAGRQKFQVIAQAGIGQLAQAGQREQEKTEKERSQEIALSAMNQPTNGILFEANQEKEEDGSRRQGPPPPMNPTPEPTKTQEEIRAQAEPTLVIRGVPHNADLDPDAGVFEAQGTWVGLDEKGQLPDPPKDKVALYDVGFLYGQTPDGKAELVASEGDVHAYIHNAQRWAEAGWPKWKDWLSLAFDQGGIKIGDIVEFGGAKYKIIDTDQVDPKAMLADLFVPTKEFMGRRLVVSTCSTPPEGVYTSSTDLGLPRQVVTAVLLESEAVSA